MQTMQQTFGKFVRLIDALSGINHNGNKKALLSQRWPRDAPYLWVHALKIFESPWVGPRLLVPKFLIDFCSERSYECAYKIWSSPKSALSLH